MGFTQSIKTCLKKYIDFSGRSSRSEFWYFILFLVLVNFFGDLLTGTFTSADGITFGLYFGLGSNASWWTNIFSGFFLIPFLSVMTRRLNDSGFPVGKLISAGLAGVIVLSYLSKLTDDQLPIIAVVAPFLIFMLVFIYVLARKSAAGPNIHGPNPNEVPS